MLNVLTCAEMRAADKHTIENLAVSSLELMERAGKAIAEEAEKLLALRGGRVLVVCGGGNNGGDGWVAARCLVQSGYEVRVYTLTDKLTSDCAEQRKKFEALAAGIPLISSAEVCAEFPDDKFDVVIDAVFGTGFHGVPEGKFESAIERMNACGAPILSADIPSGLNGDSGSAVCCVRASFTVAIGEIKRGLLLGEGPDACGKVVRRDIGIELPVPAAGGLCSAEDFKGIFPYKKKNTNKGSFGKAAILAGSLRYSGAPFLTAAAALKCGCGYTQLVLPSELFPYAVGKIPEAILTEAPSQDGAFRFDEAFLLELMKGTNAIAVGMGCGVSEELYKIIEFLLSEFRGTLVLDADALNALSEYGADILCEKTCRVILTPHPKEFARLSGNPIGEVLKNGPTLAHRFASEHGAIVLLKGHTSVITNGKFSVYNTEGTPALAKGGSGDVLSGIIVSLAARGVSAMDSACCGAFLLGRAGMIAAERAGNEYSPCATDVIAALHRAITEISRENK